MSGLTAGKLAALLVVVTLVVIVLAPDRATAFWALVLVPLVPP